MGAIAILACRQPAGEPTIEQMLDRVPHRGDERAFSSSEGIAVGVLGAGRDAWIAQFDGRVAALVGRLDNAEEVWRKIGRPDEPCPDPARILLEGARRLGLAETAASMRGRFAFAVAQDDRLEVGRDQIGYVPLFVAERAGRAVFGTEIKQVLAGLGGEPREPDLEFLHGLIFGLQRDWRITPYAGVERLPRATIVSYRNGRREGSARYWDPTGLLESRPIGVDEAAEGLAAVMDEAVSRVVTGNDAVGLSGGIDSPTVAAFAAPRHVELSGSPLLAVSAVFPERPEVDETPYIQAVTDHLGLELETFRQVDGALKDVESWVEILDGPGVVPSVPAIAEMYRLTASLGRSALLTGEFAEYVYNYDFRVLGYLLSRRRWEAARSRMAESRAHGRSWASLGREIAVSLAPSPVLRWWQLRDQGRPPWTDPDRYAPAPPASKLARPRHRWSIMQTMPVMSDYTLHLDDVEICAASCGIAVRMPIADVDVWEYALSLPAEVKFPSTVKKALVRQAMRGRVPDVILDRRDKTFFDTHSLDLVDFDGLRRWILAGDHRLEGVDYEMLADLLERRQLTLLELSTATTLARIHAFLGQW